MSIGTGEKEIRYPGTDIRRRQGEFGEIVVGGVGEVRYLDLGQKQIPRSAPCDFAQGKRDDNTGFVSIHRKDH